MRAKNTACFIVLVIVLLGLSASAALVTDYTKTAGNFSWSDTNIWSTGTLPVSANSVQVRKGTILAGDTIATVGEIRIFETSILNVNNTIVVDTSTLVGYGTTGTLNVNNGGSLTAQRLYYGYTSTAAGNGIISGGTVTAPDIYIGYSATGSADVTQTGGTVVAKNSLHLNYNTGANGVYHLQAGILMTGSVAFRNQSGTVDAFDWTGGTLKTADISYFAAVDPAFNQISGALDPTAFNGDGSVNEISTLNIHAAVGAASYTLSGDAHLQMQLAGTTAGISYDQLLVEGDFSAGGTLDIALIDGFSVTLGDTFNIIDAATFAGQFDQVNLPTLSGGLGWNTDRLMTDGILEVVSIPEPAAASLVAMGGLLAVVIRRQQQRA